MAKKTAKKTAKKKAAKKKAAKKKAAKKAVQQTPAKASTAVAKPKPKPATRKSRPNKESGNMACKIVEPTRVDDARFSLQKHEGESDSAFASRIGRAIEHEESIFDRLVVKIRNSDHDKYTKHIMLEQMERWRKDCDKYAPSLWVCFWRQQWAAYYEAAKLVGVVFDEDMYNDFRDWCISVPMGVAYQNICVVSKWPEILEWNERDVLHNDNGPAALFKDGFALWLVDGVQVDRQIVMHPETQTIKQIDSESNGDVRAVRVARYGWPRYLKDTNSTCMDTRDNAVSNTPEALYQTPNGERRFAVGCPTGRMFVLSVPPSVNTCEEAQTYLAGAAGVSLNVIAAT